MKFFLPAVAVFSFVFSSCIKEEALNAECDITGVDSTWLADNADMLVGKPIITNDYVSFSIKKKEGVDRSQLAPAFTLTPGATITMMAGGAEIPANGQKRDFSSPQTYTVHSEDGRWKKDYSVSFNFPQPISLCSFEHFDLDKTGRYNQWFETDSSDVQNPRRNYWASGNPGFALTGMGKVPSDYPTLTDPLGVSGNCIRLVTRNTGSFGQMVGMPIAAGNIFIGEFDTQKAMGAPLEATHFGLQLVGGEPIRLEGCYKYKAGDVVTDKKLNVLPDKKDTADIYAVLYEVDPANFVSLKGDDVLSSDRIVMLARIADPGEPSDWKHFSEDFKLMPGKQFSEERLGADGYAIAVVATSSRQGAFFEGAIGSTLYVDELKIVWKGEEME